MNRQRVRSIRAMMMLTLVAVAMVAGQRPRRTANPWPALENRRAWADTTVPRDSMRRDTMHRDTSRRDTTHRDTTYRLKPKPKQKPKNPPRQP
jgi:hypothetical protein